MSVVSDAVFGLELSRGRDLDLRVLGVAPDVGRGHAELVVGPHTARLRIVKLGKEENERTAIQTKC